jgi:hypothetical protein
MPTLQSGIGFSLFSVRADEELRQLCGFLTAGQRPEVGRLQL